MAQETRLVFSKAKWLASANAQMNQGILTQREIDDALEIWVNNIDGKTQEEIAEINGSNTSVRADWFIEITE